MGEYLSSSVPLSPSDRRPAGRLDWLANANLTRYSLPPIDDHPLNPTGWPMPASLGHEEERWVSTSPPPSLSLPPIDDQPVDSTSWPMPTSLGPLSLQSTTILST